MNKDCASTNNYIDALYHIYHTDNYFSLYITRIVVFYILDIYFF